MKDWQTSKWDPPGRNRAFGAAVVLLIASGATFVVMVGLVIVVG